jgi:hypothetical protein
MFFLSKVKYVVSCVKLANEELTYVKTTNTLFVIKNFILVLQGVNPSQI